MLRYETEFTPCTGITAVTKQERRHFKQGLMIAPWCPNLVWEEPLVNPLQNGRLTYTDLRFEVEGLPCRLLVSTDDFIPTLLIEMKGRFKGKKTPYDIPIESLRDDTLFFGLAVRKLLDLLGKPGGFVWAADWETVPAMLLSPKKYKKALTLHNTFDECLEIPSLKFGEQYKFFQSKRKKSAYNKTALEIGLENADVITTVNRGFAWGMRNELIQTEVMAPHMQHLLKEVVGINNAPFKPVDSDLRKLAEQLTSNSQAGEQTLFERQLKARRELSVILAKDLQDKVIVVGMGRRVAQKLHGVMVESVRQILREDPKSPLFVIFTTVAGDRTSPARLRRMQALADEFPQQVVCLDGRMDYFGTLMQAADYNCMASLYEPHGGAFEDTVIPIARAIDGLAEQICGMNATGKAAEMNDLWHRHTEEPTGFLFREDIEIPADRMEKNLRVLLTNPHPKTNELFKAIQAALKEALIEGVNLRSSAPARYAQLVRAAINKQVSYTWEDNLAAMLKLINEVETKE